MPLAESESDSWQRYALDPDSRQRIALTPSFPGVSLGWKQKTFAGRRGNIILIIRQEYPLSRSNPGGKGDLPVFHAGRNFGEEDVAFLKTRVASVDRSPA
jgi:hypothetical protein